MSQSDPNSLHSAWYLVYAKPRQERIALEHLNRQGYEAYLPLLRTRRHGREINKLVPMFPRYLFVNLTPEKDNFSPIRSTFGVSQLVRFGRDYAILPDDFIASLRGQSDEKGSIEVPEEALVRGDPVEIFDGAMTGYGAIFSENIGKDRVALLLKIADRQVRIEAARSSVQRI